MKKSKKALLWSIIPILGVSGGIAGAIAGVTTQNTSTSVNSTVTLNSVNSVAKSRSTNEVTNKLEITSQTYDVVVGADDFGDYIYVEVDNKLNANDLNYTWKVNKGYGWEYYPSDNKNSIYVEKLDEVDTMQTWTFRCIVTNIKTGDKVVSDDIKFTMLSWEGEHIDILEQPTPKTTANGGETVTLNVQAEGIDLFEEEDEIGYRWFEYDSENNKYTIIDGADKSTYTFTAPFTSETQTKKYVCRFYLKSDFGKYISESNQAIVTINKSESQTKPEETLKVSSLVKHNQASVRNNFYSNTRVDSAWYEVDVKDARSNEGNLVYQWYYIGRDGKEHLIEGTNNSNKLTPNKNLFEAVYKDNSNHRVGIMCKIYKDGKLDKIIDQKNKQ